MEEENPPARLDIWLQQKHPELSRSHIQKLIKDGSVKVNSRVVTKPSVLVDQGSKVRLAQKNLRVDIPSIELPVLYEDETCVVINKPLGILTHSKGAYNPEATVATWLATRPNFNFPPKNTSVGSLTDGENANSERFGIVHRLDRATSGVMICAKNPAALGHLQKQFQTRKAKKTYIARVAGRMKHSEAKLDLPIERNPKRPQTFRVGPNGKSAYTEYKVLQEFEKGSLLELRPETGRTHQLRVHLQHLGHPIVGDTLYGGKPAERLYLHAVSLEITLPEGGVRKTFEAPVPKEFYDGQVQ